MEITKSRIQEKISLLDIDELDTLNNIANDKTKQICNNYIDRWRKDGLLYGYFGAKCNNIYNRKRVTNNAILELYIYYCYEMFERDVDKDEQETFRHLANYYYNDGIKQAGGKPKEIPNQLYYNLLKEPCVNGYTLEEYKGAKALQSTYQTHRLAVSQIQQGQLPKVRNMEREFEHQLNERLKVGARISGVIDMILIGINNRAIIEGAKSIIPPTKTLKAKFVAVIDDRTTPMCESLHGQEFNVYGENEFTRWSDSHKQMRKYKCYGLVRGLNEPPISDHFHWCRSGIEIIVK